MSNAAGYTYLFGPVPSRRFGRSLGIDLVPMKTCTLDCLFCQLGRTPTPTAERREYAPTRAVLHELETWLREDGQADFLTLSGSGEPTLHVGFGDVLEFVETHTRIPRLLLTNGTLLHLPEVRQGAAHASVVKMSLSAWDPVSFQRMNRCGPDVTFEQLVEGEKAFRAEFGGEIRLEVFLLQGINSDPADVAKIARLAGEIAPDRVELNTVARPPADRSAVAVPHAQLAALAELFTPRAEIVAPYTAKAGRVGGVSADDVLAMLRRRPCTARQIADVFGIHVNEVAKHLGALIERDAVRREDSAGESFYVAR